MASSWSPPMPDCPFALSTPTTLNGSCPMRIVCPIGSDAPNRFWRTVWPITATSAAVLTSSSVNDDPDDIGQLRMSKYCGSVPLTEVDQLLLSNTTCECVDAPGAALA